ARGADLIADRTNHVITAEDHGIENETEPECVNLVRLYVNDFREEFLHWRDGRARPLGAPDGSASRPLPMLFLPSGKRFRFAFGCQTGPQFRLSCLRELFETGQPCRSC